MTVLKDISGLFRLSAVWVAIGLAGGFFVGVIVGQVMGGSDVVGWQRVASIDVAAVEVVSVTDDSVVYVRSSDGQNTRCTPTGRGGMFDCVRVSAAEVEPTPPEAPACADYDAGKPGETPGYVVSAVHHRVCTDEMATLLDVIAISDGSVWIWHSGTGALFNFNTSTVAPGVGAVLGGLLALGLLRLRGPQVEGGQQTTDR